MIVYGHISCTCLTQRILCKICISIFGAFSAGKKCALYMDKYGNCEAIQIMCYSSLWEIKMSNAWVSSFSSSNELSANCKKIYTFSLSFI